MTPGIIGWVGSVRDRLHRDQYVDFADIPDPPEGPYRARSALAPAHDTPRDIEVKERSVVKGELQLLYVTRCPCGRRWVTPHFSRMNVCPRCDRVVVVDTPELAPS